MPTTEPTTLCTIGYEGIDQGEFLKRLSLAPVDLLVDTRHRAGSRKKGFGKTALTASLAEIGVAYAHHRELGTPPELMKLLRERGSYSLASYEDHFLDNPALKEHLLEVVLDGGRVALLCYEADPRVCHRSVLAKHASLEADLKVLHL